MDSIELAKGYIYSGAVWLLLVDLHFFVDGVDLPMVAHRGVVGLVLFVGILVLSSLYTDEGEESTAETGAETGGSRSRGGSPSAD